eukprot:297264_1
MAINDFAIILSFHYTVRQSSLNSLCFMFLCQHHYDPLVSSSLLMINASSFCLSLESFCATFSLWRSTPSTVKSKCIILLFSLWFTSTLFVVASSLGTIFFSS